MGGGVILAIAVALWLVYLVPSWLSRHQFNATERNAVRLNQALRILAQTSETPDELELELDARTAYEQTKLAKKAELARSRAEKERLRAEADRAREIERIAEDSEREIAREQAEHDRARAREAAEIERERVRIAAIAEHQAIVRRRAELMQERRAAAAEVAVERAAGARRRTRLVAAAIMLLGLIASGIGIGMLVGGGSAWMLVGGATAALVGFGALRRASSVARRVAHRPVEVARPVTPEAVQRVSVLHDEPAPRWTPRELPQPLTSLAGSSASAAVAQNEARAALRRAALDEAMRHRSAEQAPVRLDRARVAERPTVAAAPMHRVGAGEVGASDEEIEAHVRDLLIRRAAS